MKLYVRTFAILIHKNNVYYETDFCICSVGFYCLHFNL